MAITASAYASGIEGIMDRTIDVVGDSFKVMLLTNAYTPVPETQIYLSAINSNEVVGTGYVAGGAALGSVTITNSNGVVSVDPNDGFVEWDPSTITARYGVVYQDTGNAATSRLLSYVDLGADKNSNNDGFRISWNLIGLVSVSV